ncbi:hypothetical protein BDF14DRAFT_1716073 [Spinellus fusiger]|nr:hypothetical protein BDF14DRAFT_1716073 [Spinellus fusiger]
MTSTTDTADYDPSKYTDIVQSWHSEPNQYLSRYFTLFFHIETNDSAPEGTLFSDIYVRQSPNKICVLGMAPSHAFLKQENLADSKIEFKTDIIGKKVKANTIIAEVRKNGLIYAIRAQMQGQLLELNPRLVENPELLWEHTMDIGFIAVIMSATDNTQQQLHGFLTEDEYRQKIKESE